MATAASLSMQGVSLQGEPNAVPVARALERSVTLTELNLAYYGAPGNGKRRKFGIRMELELWYGFRKS